MVWQWNYKIYCKVQKVFIFIVWNHLDIQLRREFSVREGYFLGDGGGVAILFTHWAHWHYRSKKQEPFQTGKGKEGAVRSVETDHIGKSGSSAGQEMLQCCLKNIFLWNSRQLERGDRKPGFCSFSNLKLMFCSIGTLAPFPQERAAAYSSLRYRCTSSWSEEPASWQQAPSIHTFISRAQSACGIAGGFQKYMGHGHNPLVLLRVFGSRLSNDDIGYITQHDFQSLAVRTYWMGQCCIAAASKTSADMSLHQQIGFPRTLRKSLLT